MFNIGSIKIAIIDSIPDIGKQGLYISLAGCNLNCSGCYSPERTGNETKSVEELRGVILDSKTDIVIFTGGEPLLQQDAILSLFNEPGLGHIKWRVETNGTILPQLDLLLRCRPLLVCLKTQWAGQQAINTLEHWFSWVTYANLLCSRGNEDLLYFKFVVKDENDLQAAMSMINVLPERANVFIQPYESGSLFEEKVRSQRDIFELIKPAVVLAWLRVVPRIITA
jgi:organic radical activating enzyme